MTGVIEEMFQKPKFEYGMFKMLNILTLSTYSYWANSPCIVIQKLLFKWMDSH